MFAIAAYGCDLVYVPLGWGIAKTIELDGQRMEGSSQGVVLHKSYQSTFGRNPPALILGIHLSNGVTFLNITSFWPSLWRKKKKQRKNKPYQR